MEVIIQIIYTYVCRNCTYVCKICMNNDKIVSILLNSSIKS